MENNQIKFFWQTHNDKIVLVILLTIFMAYSAFLACNLKPGIIPDEPAHFTFSKHYASTWGIPSDAYETYSLGWYIEQNPFLYYWINGRIINVAEGLFPSINDLQMLLTLRTINTIFALGTLIFCYFLSKQVFKNKWLRLLPVFLLSNTLMFVFISAGVNYDNLANLFSMAGIYYLVRVLQKNNFFKNSLSFLSLLGLGSLVKYTILPLLLAAVIVWLVYIILNRNSLKVQDLFQQKKILLLLLFVGVLAGNVAIYGTNLILYQSVTPPCREILLESQCEISPYEIRREDVGLEKRMTIRESIDLGYPNPAVYAGHKWVTIMLLRTFGMEGHLNYNPHHLINFFRILFYGGIILMLINFKKFSFDLYCLIGVFGFYALVLLVKNYNTELLYAFQHISLQGRYIFPVIGPAYVVFTKTIQKTNNCFIRRLTLAFTLALFTIAGPIIILVGYQRLFTDWFM